MAHLEFILLFSFSIYFNTYISYYTVVLVLLCLFKFVKCLLCRHGTKEKVENFHTDKINFNVDVCGGSDVTS